MIFDRLFNSCCVQPPRTAAESAPQALAVRRPAPQPPSLADASFSARDTVVAQGKPQPDRRQTMRRLLAELHRSVAARNERVYGKATIAAARNWHTHDLASVKAVVDAMQSMCKPIPESARDIVLLRSMPRTATYLDPARRRVFNNPGAVAAVRDLHDPEFRAATKPADRRAVRPPGKLLAARKDGSAMKLRKHGHASLPHGGINVLVGTRGVPQSNPYSDPNAGTINIQTTLRDVLARGGKLHTDSGSCVLGSVVVQMPPQRSLPYVELPNQARWLPSSYA